MDDISGKKVLMVVGSHRSGTSAVARGLNALGINLGPTLLQGESEENPKGFWEDIPTLALCDGQLSDMGMRWNDAHLPTPADTQRISSKFVELAERLLRQRLKVQSAWGVKNPRLSILAATWQPVFGSLGLNDCYVVCIRHPWSVAGSLAQRNSMAMDQAIDLWTSYTLQPINHVIGRKHVFVSYENLLSEPERELRRIAGALDIAIDSRIEARIDDYGKSFLDPALNREGIVPEATSLPDQTKRLYELAAKLCRDERTLTDDHSAGEIGRLSEQIRRSQPPKFHVRTEERPGQKPWWVVAELMIGLLETTLEDSQLPQFYQALELSQALASQKDNFARLTEKLKVARRQVQLHEAEREVLERRIAELKHAFAALEKSARWRIGNQIGELKRQLMWRPYEALATDFIRDTFTDLDSWLAERKNMAPSGSPQGDLAPSRPRRSQGAAWDARAQHDIAPILLDLPNPVAPLSIVVPVHNAPEALAECLDSVIGQTTFPAELLIIDDASTDPAIAPLLAQYGKRSGVRILVNESNLGFTATANRGLRETTGDMVLLNSDVVVGPRWLENLHTAAHARSRVGTVTAISDNAGAFSMPVPGQPNAEHPALCAEDTIRAVSQESAGLLAEVPTGNGFCLYIKRSLVDEIGIFNVAEFPLGYGEENDFGMRALAAGYRQLIDERTYVFHREGASFGEKRSKLMARGTENIRRLHPSYEAFVADAFGGADVADARNAVGSAIARAATAHNRPAPRIMMVVQDLTGAVARATRALAAELRPLYETLILSSDGDAITVHACHGERLVRLDSVNLRVPITDLRVPNAIYASFVTNMLRDHAIEIVHIHEFGRHTFELVSATRALAIPVVLTPHDYFAICPTGNLRDADRVFCGGSCTPGKAPCQVSDPYLGRIPGLKHGWVNDWRKSMIRWLGTADAIVVPSNLDREVFARAFPTIDQDRWEAPDGHDWHDPSAVDEAAEIDTAVFAKLADDYDETYRAVRLRRRSFHVGADRLPRVGILPQMVGNTPISSCDIRLTRPLDHPTARSEVAWRFRELEEVVSGGVRDDIILVQRSAVPADKTDAVIAACEKSSARLVWETDDDLFQMDVGHPEYSSTYCDSTASMRRLAEAADVITTSTETIAATLRTMFRNVAVVPNTLDEFLWFGGAHDGAVPDRDDDVIELVYVGTATHASDLAVVREALEMLRTRSDLSVQLTMIGGETAGRNQDWYRRIPVPQSKTRYPNFVRWLRRRAARWDIALAPLQPTPFNAGKSCLKYQEYSALGLPGIYINNDAYRHVVRHDETGILVDFEPNAWADAIAHLASAKDLRQEIAAAAFADVSTNHVAGNGGARDFARQLASLAMRGGAPQL